MPLACAMTIAHIPLTGSDSAPPPRGLAGEEGGQRLADSAETNGWRRDLTVAVIFVRAGDQVDGCGVLGRLAPQARLELAGCFGRTADYASGGGPLQEGAVGRPGISGRCFGWFAA